MRVGIAADHGGYLLKTLLMSTLQADAVELTDFGAHELDPDDDYPDWVIPLADAVARGEIDRGVAICGSGVGACVTANKVPGVRASLITDCYSAHQGVEDDDMNLICLGGRVTGESLALELVETFLGAEYLAADRFQRRLRKVTALEGRRLHPAGSQDDSKV